jgi:hypothetical protein
MVFYMSDDSFIREVNEELRQDRVNAAARRYGPFVIGLAVLVVLATAAYVGYDYWSQGKANKSGDAFSQALELANQGEQDKALAAFQDLEQNGYGAYPVLARMRAATVLADKGDFEGAVKSFDEVAADGSVPDSIRDIARLRAGLILVDHGTYEDVAKRVETLTGDENAMRNSAREALGLAAWKAGKTGDAMDLFQQIVADQAAPQGVRQRAQMMTELITASGAAT